MSEPDAAAPVPSSPVDMPDTPTPPAGHSQGRSEETLRARLALHSRDWALPRPLVVRGWVVTACVTVVAALTRLVGLGHPHYLMFDEIYYIKDAYALWHNGYESTWADDADKLFASGDFSALTTQPSFIVHPQLGKWLIGLGGQLLGWDSSFAWRLVPALAGIATVALLTRLTMRLTGSAAVAGLAGFFLAIDGVAITESRIGLLDVFVGFFAVLTLYCVVRDREWFRARLAQGLAGSDVGSWAPVPLVRPWLLAAGISAGLTCSIKWSGAYLLAAVGIMVVVWDGCALYRVRARQWLMDALLHRGLLDFLHLVPTAFLVYVAGWWSWFLHDGAYKHGWASSMRAAGTPVRSWLPDSLNDLLEYHLAMYRFHVGLDSTHPYMSHPIGWLAQWRPTSFYWQGTSEMASQCPHEECVQAITSIGNIPLWWSAIAALVGCVIVGVLRRRDWRIWVALAGYCGLYLPWFAYSHRTIFTFYTVEFVPFVMLVLAFGLGWCAGWIAPLPRPRATDVISDDVAPLVDALTSPASSASSALAGQPGDLPADGQMGVSGVPVDTEAARMEVAGGQEKAAAAGGQVVGAVQKPDGPVAPYGRGVRRRGRLAEYLDLGEVNGAVSRWLTLPESWTGVPREHQKPEGAALIALLGVIAVIFAGLWWPIWTGETVSYEFWHLHMLLPSWI